ncbi:MAG TPA: GAF domain-containing sensor histidine kinase [Ktedonobacteraceae bacterium]
MFPADERSSSHSSTEVQLEARVEERTKELSLLLKVSQIVASTLEFKPLLNTILEQLKTVVDYSGAAIYSLQDNQLKLLNYLGPLQLSQLEQLWQYYERSPHYQRLRQQREAIIVDDLHGNTKFVETYRKVLGEEEHRGIDQRFHSWMVIPLIVNERFIGLLTVSHSRSNFYTPEHSRLAFAIANQAAVALENAYLYKRAQELAVLQERQRLARELHDSVSQELYGISLGAHAALEALETEPSQSIAALEHIILHARVGLAEMRALLLELRPELLETEGLVAALNKRVEVLRARYNLAVEVYLEEEPAMALEGKHALFRIAQEAFHNITKHAHASKVWLRLAHERQGLVLEVRDNGNGFDPTCDFPGHFGLRSMHERVTSLNGAISIESAPGKGTSICARIPSIK